MKEVDQLRKLAESIDKYSQMSAMRASTDRPDNSALQAEYVKMRALRTDALKAYVLQKGFPEEDLIGLHDAGGVLEAYMAFKYGDGWGSKI